MRGVKAESSGRESCGNKAIGYVKLKTFHDPPICIVKARITPEHKVQNKPYYVKVLINESVGKIVEALWEDYAAAPDCCKDIVAFISWLHRRSEEPPTTELKCYWQKSTLSKIGTELKFVKARDIGATKIRDLTAMARGRALEPLVIKEVESVSPDGICEEYVIKVKCASKESTMENYHSQDGKINSKYFAQIQLEKYYCNKKEGLFCVAAHNFTDTKNVKIFKVPFDQEYCDNLIADCIHFWKTAIFPLLVKY
ncbi:hypothetical protein FQA39_LY04196 [Lamprigera yunnana]|nr:hypothetical protein FQA39_LY04196 [Lamprigera yunnana]